MTSSSDQKQPPNNLSDALSMRYPVVWVNNKDTIETISRVCDHIAVDGTIEYYVFNDNEGLQKFNYHTQRFDTVLKRVQSDEGDVALVPLAKLDHAFGYLEDRHDATLLVANAEKFKEGLNDYLTFSSYGWRRSWLEDDTASLGFQLILTSSTEANPPAAVRSFVPVISYGLPTKGELANIAVTVKERFGSDFDIEEVARVSRGLSAFEAIDMYNSMVARTGSIDVKEIEDLIFERLASRAGLNIFKPQKTLDEVAGGTNIKKVLNTASWMKENPEEARKYGFQTNIHRFLLLGLPGTGKSMTAEGAADYVNLNLIRTGLTDQLSMYHGQSEQNTIALFDQIDALDPVVVWCDEFGRDVTGGESSGVVDGGTTSRTHGIFLTRLQELKENTYFFAAANDISSLPPEMLRADRFDRIFFFGMPTYSQRLKIISDGYRKVETHSVDVGTAARATASFTGAELITAMNIASSYACEERRPMETKDYLKAAASMKERLWMRYRNHVVSECSAAVNKYQWACDDQMREAEEFYARGKVPPGDFESSEVVKHEPRTLQISSAGDIK